MKKKNYIWKIVVAIATVIIPLVVFFTGYENIIELWCGKKTHTHQIETTVIKNEPVSIQIKTTGVVIGDSAKVETINQQIGGENNIQYNITSNE